MGSKSAEPSIAAGRELFWSLTDGLDSFHIGQAGVYAGQWQGKNALYLDSFGKAVLYKDSIPYRSYRVEAEVALPGQAGFIGLVFGARDTFNYELVYLASEEIQYNPIMKGSMTWQIYNGTHYQKPLPDTTRKWMKLAVEVHGQGARVYLNDAEEPVLVISKLQHGPGDGGIGFWSNLPACIRNLAVTEIAYEQIMSRDMDYSLLESEGIVTKWQVSQALASGERGEARSEWKPVLVEENGTLNFNRLSQAIDGACVAAESFVELAEEASGWLTFGFSDAIRLWFNDVLVYEGEWCWRPPTADGRIRVSYAAVEVLGIAGVNHIRAEIVNHELFGWGLTMRADFSRK